MAERASPPKYYKRQNIHHPTSNFSFEFTLGLINYTSETLTIFLLEQQETAIFNKHRELFLKIY